jgi:hypothetical protein
LDALVSSSLTDNTFADPTTVLGRVLIDPDAREMMKYVARCALTTNQSLSWGSFTFSGYFGFCPHWQDDPPGTDDVCLQRVSACILSLNNYFHKQVTVFQTWEDPNLHGTFAPPLTRTETINRDNSMDVASFAPCSGPFGAARNCGWTPDFAGRCTPGQRILLGAGATPNDLSCGGCATCPTLGQLISGQVVLRACAGLSGCDHLSGRNLAESTGMSCEPGGAALAFDCPGPAYGPNSGYFSVMQGPYIAGGNGLGQVASPASVEFPVSVLRAYTKREGAYFGNIFNSGGLADGVNVYVDDSGGVQGKDVQIRGAIYQNMYACFDNQWRRAQLYFSGRICAQPSIDPIQSQNCASTVAGPCRADSSPPQAITPPQLPFRCTVDHSDDPIGYGDLEDCSHYDGTSWPYSATVFLNGGCDLTDNIDSCQRFDDQGR